MRGAYFNRNVFYNPNSGITPAQLYSTASYLAHDLSGIGLESNNLSNANLVGQNLTNASLSGATLTGANLSGAKVRGATFYSTGITTTQLYSTASYIAHDLTEIKLGYNNLAGANLGGQNLTGAIFQKATLTNANFNQANLTNADLSYGTDLTGANLSQANLTNANFAGSYQYCDDYHCYGAAGANLTGANLSGADGRGANFQFAVLTGANTANLIQSYGNIAGLDLTAGASLVVRDYDGNPAAYPTPASPLSIVVDERLAMDATGTLRLMFDADPWDSTIYFAPGIPVTLGGTLDLTFAPASTSPPKAAGRSTFLIGPTSRPPARSPFPAPTPGTSPIYTPPAK